VYRFQLRDAANLGVSAAFTSKWVPCWGARLVTVYYHATSGDQDSLASNTFDLSNDPVTGGGIFVAGSGQSSTILLITGATSFRLDGTAGLFVNFTPATAMLGHIPWRYLRVTGVAGAAQIDNFEIYALVYYDDDSDIQLYGALSGVAQATV
jgi:hypothetical protein